MSQKLLAVHAAAIEGDHLGGSGVVQLGVGKVAAAVTMYEVLRAERPDAVLLFGVCGAYPDRHRQRPPRIGLRELCLCGSDQYGDEGSETPKGFLDLQALGFGDVGPFAADAALTARIAALLDAGIVRGCTVSTCSGTEPRSEILAVRSNADVESMEGAAVAFVCRRLNVPFAQLRCVSNWTGDRAHGEWDVAGALAVLRPAVQRVLGELQG